MCLFGDKWEEEVEEWISRRVVDEIEARTIDSLD